MKKRLLLFLFIFLANYLVYAQCKTCKLGQHAINDTSFKASYQHSSSNVDRVMNGNSSFGQSYILQNVCGLNYITSSVLIETRSKTYSFNDSGSGFPAPLSITGLCGVNRPQKAYVYYDASYTEASAPNTSVTIKNPSNVTSTYASVLIGTAQAKCWGEVGTACYRCDITAAISGNGSYSITSINGFANAAWEVDGATMIIIYTTAATYSGSIVLWDGCITNFGTYSFTGNGFSACAATANAWGFCAYGDMQDNASGGINTEQYNGVSKTFWNSFWNLDQIKTSLTNGQNTFVYNSYTNNGGDCWTWVFAGLYWQNTTCLSCNTTCVLPVELMYFNCTPNADDGVNTSWATASESNNKNFEVERSVDGHKWQTIATVPGAGNSSKTLYYAYTDNNQPAGTVYYRLKQNDFDGSYIYSDVQTVAIATSAVEIFPNPTSGDLKLTYYAQNTEQINAIITDITGKVIAVNPLQAQAGVNTYTIHTPTSPGMYIVQIGNEQHRRYLKFIKQ